MFAVRRRNNTHLATTPVCGKGSFSYFEHTEDVPGTVQTAGGWHRVADARD